MANDTLKTYLTSIANAIRSKTGKTDKINANNFPTEIQNIPSPIDGVSLDGETIVVDKANANIVTKQSSTLSTANNASLIVDNKSNLSSYITVNLNDNPNRQNLVLNELDSSNNTNTKFTYYTKNAPSTLNDSEIRLEKGTFNLVRGGATIKAPYLSPSNIKKDVSILGVTGTFTDDATATAEKIANGSTAYVNGQKITGTLTVPTDVIKSGVNVLGNYGTFTAEPSSVSAEASDITKDKVAYVNGERIVGTSTSGVNGVTVDTNYNTLSVNTDEYSRTTLNDATDGDYVVADATSIAITTNGYRNIELHGSDITVDVNDSHADLTLSSLINQTQLCVSNDEGNDILACLNGEITLFNGATSVKLQTANQVTFYVGTEEYVLTKKV